VLSLILLAGAVAAYYGFRLAGAWRWIFVACAVAALYLNVFVLVAQGFMKIPALHALAPTGSEPPFAIVQGIVLLIFIALGIWAVIKFRPIDDRRWAGR
jgi:MFS family permease